MRPLLLLLAFLATGFARCQTGPGGVGNNTSNVLWLSADVGVTTTGTAVTAWNDRSGNGNNAAPSSVAARPTLTAAALNNAPVITFDGVNDELLIADVPMLDLQQWDIFMVNADAAPKNNNVWLAKGTNAQPNYALWSTNTDALAMPIYDIFGFLSAPATAAGTTAATYNVFQYTNTVILFVFPSRNLYKNGTSIYTDASLLQLPQTNNASLRIGNAQGAAGWNLNGSIPEIIVYNAPVNSAQRIIVSNYLAAKYGLTLSSNDIYVQDNPAQGDYDHEVAGIGRITSTSQHTDSQGSSVVRINNPTGLGNNEFLLWGHDNGTLGSWGSTDVPVGVDRRWHRVWRVSEVSPAGAAVDVGNVDMTFDLTGQGPVTASDLRLLVDINNNGVFADDAAVGIAATALGGNLYRFAGVSQLVNGRRFTLATINYQQTPLPVELLFFDAEATDAKVRLSWATATEHESDRFVVQRSGEGSTWTDAIEVRAAGNSSTRIDYTAIDAAPLNGLSYYRLAQLDRDGVRNYSNAVPVTFTQAGEPVLRPNPSRGLVSLALPGWHGKAVVEVIDGRGHRAKILHVDAEGFNTLDLRDLPEGTYLVRAGSDRDVRVARLVIAR